MNTSTWARDHFLENAWRSFFSVFTLGLIIDPGFTEAGQAAFYSFMFLAGLSLFYHSAIRARLPWLDRILVTPQVHRIHHSVDLEPYNKNFADALAIFDILFGTCHRPQKGESFPPQVSVPKSAQFGPLLAVGNMLIPKHDPQPQNRHAHRNAVFVVAAIDRLF